MTGDELEQGNDDADRELVYETTFECDASDLSDVVIRSVAAVEDRPAIHLWPPLQSAVDVEALDRLFAPTGADDHLRTGTVKVTYHGYRIEVDTATQQLRIYG